MLCYGWFHVMIQLFKPSQLSFLATTSEVLERKSFRSVYMTNYLGQSVNPVRLALMKQFGWTQVATLVFKGEIYESQISDFHKIMATENYTLVTSAIIYDPEVISDHMVRLKQYDARIIMAAFRSTYAPYIFCQAYKHGLYGVNYQWILSGASMYSDWIKNADVTKTGCTRHEIVQASAGYFAVDDVYLRSDNQTITVSGRTSVEYLDHVNRIYQEINETRLSRSNPHAYDAAWALALALNITQAKLNKGALNDSRLKDFDYTRQDMLDIMLDSLQEVNFEGVSGRVSFTDKGQRLGPKTITQFFNDTSKIVARFHPEAEDPILWNVKISQLFEGGEPPRDVLRKVNRYVPSSTGAVAIVVIINSLGMASGFAFLIFNIFYRNNKHIKMSSPNINNIIVAGCLLMYMFVYVTTAEYSYWTNDDLINICMIRTWLVSIGFTLSFGALFSKTWRVHALFRHKQLKRKIIRDTRLLTIVSCLVLVDLVILLPWTTKHPLTRHVHREVSEEDSTRDEVVTMLFGICDNSQQIYYFMAEYIFKGLLLVFGAFLTWETRMVKIPALNDSKLIGFCIYNVFVFCVLVVPITHVLDVRKTTLLFVLTSLSVSLCTTLVLAILFIPKIKLRNQVTETRFVMSLRQPGESEKVSNHVACSFTSKVVPKQLTPREAISGQDRASLGSDIFHDNASGQVCILKGEVNRLNDMLESERQAVLRLRAKIFKESNHRLNFHRVGNDYVLFGNYSTEFDNLSKHLLNNKTKLKEPHVPFDVDIDNNLKESNNHNQNYLKDNSIPDIAYISGTNNQSSLNLLTVEMNSSPRSSSFVTDFSYLADDLNDADNVKETCGNLTGVLELPNGTAQPTESLNV